MVVARSLIRLRAPRRALLLGAPALLLAGAERVPVAARPISRMETPWWRKRHEEKLIEARRRRGIQLVWLGDSITQDWEEAAPEPWRDFKPAWQHFYGGRHALNLGFKGDATSHLLWRMQNGELAGLAPKAAVILIGANNMGLVHWNAEQSVAGIDAVVHECLERLPRTSILLLSVLPSIRSKYVDRTTIQINHALAARYGNGQVPGVTYMDVTSLFMKDGQVDRTQFLDPLLTPPDPPLHPTAQAQGRLAAAIDPVLSKLLGDAPRR